MTNIIAERLLKGMIQNIMVFRTGRSAAWLARSVRDAEAGGSNPLAPTTDFIDSLSDPVVFSTCIPGGRLLFPRFEKYDPAPQISRSALKFL